MTPRQVDRPGQLAYGRWHPMRKSTMSEDYKAKYRQLLGEFDQLQQQSRDRVDQLYEQTTAILANFRDTDKELGDAIRLLPVRLDDDQLPLKKLSYINELLGAAASSTVGGSNDNLPRQGEDGSGPVADPLESARQVLSHLLEQLPAELSRHLDQENLRRAIIEAGDAEQLLGTSAQIRTGILLFLDDRDDQVRELSGFLENIVARLDGLTVSLLEGDNLRRESRLQRGHFSDSVGDEVKHIRASVAAADDLNTLQQAIETRLNSIDRSVSSFVQAESARAEQAQAVAETLRDKVGALEAEANEMRVAMAKAQAEVGLDSLTRVPNRRAYDERIGKELSIWQDQARPRTLAILDIDHFKRINDDYGHPVGDTVLKAVTSRIKQQTRSTDFFGRIGGEEFAIVMVDSDARQARAPLENLRTSIENYRFGYQGKRVGVSISIGFTDFQRGDTPESLYKRADDQLLRCKQSGRNKILCHLDG